VNINHRTNKNQGMTLLMILLLVKMISHIFLVIKKYEYLIKKIRSRKKSTKFNRIRQIRQIIRYITEIFLLANKYLEVRVTLIEYIVMLGNKTIMITNRSSLSSAISIYVYKIIAYCFFFFL